jgi:hypothetical protein
MDMITEEVIPLIRQALLEEECSVGQIDDNKTIENLREQREELKAEIDAFLDKQ